jgi:hypothetical protein
MLASGGDEPGMEELRIAVDRVREEADDCLRRGPYSVTFNEGTPQGGDKHDYISYSPYWWPDPEKPDGLPFIRRDGHTNEEWKAKGDRDTLSRMTEDVEALSLGWYFYDKQQYADHALKLLRTWFIDPETKMNPHLHYAQAIPGLEEGRGAGIIDARSFVELLDAIALLQDTGAIPAEDRQALDDWFAKYLQWLLTSDYGEHERSRENNHGTWYAAQTARVALFVGYDDTAKELVEEARERLADVVQDDGSQTEELERTRSLHYSIFHLAAYIYLARMGDAVGVDLWHDEPDGGSRIRRGLDFAAPYVIDQDNWPYEEIRNYKLSPQIVQVFRMAYARYGQPVYREVLEKAERSDRDRDWSALVFSPRVRR